MKPSPTNALWALSHLSLAASQSSSLASKRGLAYLGDTHAGDENLLFSANSSIDWYYNWSPTPVPGVSLPFVPLLHGLSDAGSSSSALAASLATLPASSTHLLTFNEPDGTTSSGGSAIAPSDAARAYVDAIAPLRSSSTAGSSGRTWNISHPATTGSEAGLAWLRDFNASCWELAPESGCPADFVALHWYGDFAGLASWVGTLREFYVGSSSSNNNNNNSGAVSDDVEFWITEMALPQEGADETVDMLNQSVRYLDGLDYVAAYAWYGADRKGGSWDGYTGGNVAMFGGGGKLTDVGALYLGGEEAGFKEGMSGDASVVRASGLMAALAVLSVVFNMC